MGETGVSCLRECRVAIVGATGAVGRVFLDLLPQRGYSAGSVRLCASKRSEGKTLYMDGCPLTVELPTPRLFSEVDIAFIAASADVSRELAPIAAGEGALVVDDSSAFRMEPEVPLVVPEVNGEDLERHRGIVSIPNCSTTPLVMVLRPLNDAVPITRVTVATYQSVSGTGGAAMEELRTQSGQVLQDCPTEPDAYPHQIAFNALPQVETFTETGYTTEEMKMVHETRKILHLPELAISATCVRVPVMVGHSEAVHIELADRISPSDVREILSDFPGIAVVDDPESNLYPMPIDAAGRDEVFVGRIRQDLSHPNGIAMWVVSDNLRKGAALNSIQIAEEVVSRGLLPDTARRV